MSERANRGGQERPTERYGLYETDDGSVVIYDETNPDAYLRSDAAVDVVR